MKSKCKTCGASCEGEHCFRHKSRKPVPKSRKVVTKEPIHRKNSDFFLEIWHKKPHYSEVSGTYLGKEPLTVFFHHILPKEKYKHAAFDEDNIILLTLEEHDNVERNMYKYEKINQMREDLLRRYEK